MTDTRQEQDDTTAREKRRKLLEEIYWREQALSRIGSGFQDAMDTARKRFFWNFIGWVPAGEKLEEK